MTLAQARGAQKSFCPSEAARVLAKDWRPLIPAVRRVAAGLPLVATQRGRVVDAQNAKGPIRLQLTTEAGNLTPPRV